MSGTVYPMPKNNPDASFADTRTSLRDTAKWIVAILGATIVLVIGGGLIAKVADLGWERRLIAASCLLLLTLLCLVPLRAAIGIVAARISPFEDVARADEYAEARRTINRWLAKHYPAGINTVEKLYQEYLDQTAIANDAGKSDAERKQANSELEELQPRVKEVIELCNTEALRIRFDKLVTRTSNVLPFIGATLFIFLVFLSKEEGTEKILARPAIMQVPWNPATEASLKAAGLDAKCFAQARPLFVQLSERSGLRAGALAVPQDPRPECRPVRVVVTNTGSVYPAD